MKGQLRLTDDKWFVNNFPIHRDDYLQHLVVDDEVEYKLDHNGFARVKSSVYEACVKSLKLYFRFKHRVPEDRLEMVSPKVLELAGVKKLVAKDGSVILHIPR